MSPVTTNVTLPCGCKIECDFQSGQRGVTCSRHERTFIVTAERPVEIVHTVTKEIPYVKPPAE